KSLQTVISDEEEQLQTARTYRDRYGNVSTMETGNIGQKTSQDSGTASASSGAEACGICHRPLSAPASVSRGIGPVCAGHPNGSGGGASSSISGSAPVETVSPVQTAAASPLARDL